MKPVFNLLDSSLITKIIDEAHDLLLGIGIEIQNENAVQLLSDAGATVDNGRVKFPGQLINSVISSNPHAFKLYDAFGNETHNFSGDRIHFTPGSTALYLLDHETQKLRKPLTEDYVAYTKVISQLDHIKSQSTAFIPSDVDPKIADIYRLFLSLLYCEKPVVTGSFTVESFYKMKELLVAVRGSEKALEEKPLAIFSCCPTSPLKWSHVTCQNLLDCAKSRIPVELISMPLSGLVAPVTLVGSLIQHTAETISGIVISQLASPGTPILYGGSPAIFDMRHATTPMGAIETMMIDCAYAEIGKYLQFPTQAYISLSDAKQLDAQAGLESGIGAVLGALAGINNMSGAGMLDFESSFSLEKLVLDNEICGMALRLMEGISSKDDFPARPIFEELLAEQNLLASEHTCSHFRTEHFMPGLTIDRLNREEAAKGKDLLARAHDEVQKLVKDYEPNRLSRDIKDALFAIVDKPELKSKLNIST